MEDRRLRTGILRPDIDITTGRGRRPLRSLVGSEAAIQSARMALFWCNFGAIRMEKMDFIDSMDNPELTPSRGWTEITPMERIFSLAVQFEVKSLS
jgi:hypothetical protein